MRTFQGKVHRVMLDDDNRLYTWKRCRLSGVDFEFITHEEISQTDPGEFCQACLPSRSLMQA